MRRKTIASPSGNWKHTPFTKNTKSYIVIFTCAYMIPPPLCKSEIVPMRLQHQNNQLTIPTNQSINRYIIKIFLIIILRLFGGYEALVAGKAKDAMVDMTGGVAEGIEIKDYKTEEEKKKLFKILRKSKEAMSLISTSIAVSIHVYQ